MTSAIEVFWGGEPDEQSERDFLAQLKEDLARSNLSATILANFYTYGSSRQIDFLVVTGNHACLVELKHYCGILVGNTNGPWSTRQPDGTLEVIERQNPYNQAVLAKMAVSDEGYSGTPDVIRILFHLTACQHKRMACPRKD